MFIGYAEHSAAYRFLVLSSNVLDCNTIIETNNAEFCEHIFLLNREISHASIENNREINSDEELRRSKRTRKEFNFGNDFCTYLVDNDPLTFSEVISSSDAKFWKEAINNEINSILNNKTWILVDLPLIAKPIGCKQIFKRKYNADGTIDKYKARLVAKGFFQK